MSGTRHSLAFTCLSSFLLTSYFIPTILVLWLLDCTCSHPPQGLWTYCCLWLKHSFLPTCLVPSIIHQHWTQASLPLNVKATIRGILRIMCFSFEAHMKVAVVYLCDYFKLSEPPPRWNIHNPRKTTESAALGWSFACVRHSINHNQKDKQIYLFIPTSIWDK